MTDPVFRFAPSPNGRLHFGHAYSALLNARLARRLGGRFLLRIEDIDRERSLPAFEQGFYDDLAWLGMAWEKPVRRQSEHFDDYRATAALLKFKGLLYPCFCSRKEIMDAAARQAMVLGRSWPCDPDGTPLYPGTCRGLDPQEASRRIAAGEPHSWRIHLQMAREAAPGPCLYRCFDPDREERWVQAHPERWGDVILVRKDIPTSYHLSVVLDDALQGVTHVVRGRDLEAATDLHVLMQRILDMPTPSYHHHDLILASSGDKLSKSLGSESLKDMRARGVSAAAIREQLGFSADPQDAEP